MNDRNNKRFRRLSEFSAPSDRRGDFFATSRKLSAGLLVWLGVFGFFATVGLMVGRWLGWFK